MTHAKSCSLTKHTRPKPKKKLLQLKLYHTHQLIHKNAPALPQSLIRNINKLTQQHIQSTYQLNE